MSPSLTSHVRVHACAKINLTLRVLGIRADGYHELRTTFQSLALHDTLTFEAAPGPFTVTSDDPRCPADGSNLVWKAAQSLWAASGRRGEPDGVRVHIRKRIPMQAGLGGGSSDAASALRALHAIWRVALPEEALEGIGRGLGADVAFFLEGGTVLGVERGDLLFPLQDATPAWVVLARPDFGVGTREAYGWWDEAHLARVVTNPSQATRQDERVNDLQPPVVARHPRILSLIRKLKRSGARFSAMSGSGSAVFGLFDSRRSASLAATAIAGPRTTAWVTRTTTRREHQRVSAPRAIGRRAGARR
jgi:4-diphosphocytidyl-2-C-methyl-D-erythritol kinase